ncbi:hypothetical protein FDUTEX481_03802 [Tolypothrix sp. PCC 7601]|nr:hypothetical protein FDUTEX481_03802 [Tolypothrix sp. PCC 7601]
MIFSQLGRAFIIPSINNAKNFSNKAGDWLKYWLYLHRAILFL